MRAAKTAPTTALRIDSVSGGIARPIHDDLIERDERERLRNRRKLRRQMDVAA